MIPMPGRDTPVWNDSETLECVGVLPEAPDVKTFVFRPPSGATFVYRAGQFITLDLPVPGGNVQRTYTISSSPVSNAYLSVTVRAQQDSIGTRWMLDHLIPGMRIKAYGPAGLFPFAAQSGRQVSLHLGRLGRHSDDVHGHDPFRAGRGSGHLLHPVRQPAR
ncbi:FAD-binding oxidoreductase [Roseibium salinum]|nr:FAD-binding oxidoreductase [Roseibium salinum]